MRKKIAAANWKMNLTYQQGKALLNDLLAKNIHLNEHQQVIIAVPAPYLAMAQESVKNTPYVSIAAQNIYSKKSGAYTGETSVEMLISLGIQATILGHSERRDYFKESNEFLKAKTDLALEVGITPIFCCGEALETREQNKQNEYVEKQLRDSLFHLSAEDIKKVVIAYEPIWAIGTGKTASSEQAQEMHYFIRSIFADKYGQAIADEISILYGGSVKASNAKELFSQPDIDGGLVGGASLNADEFGAIVDALNN